MKLNCPHCGEKFKVKVADGEPSGEYTGQYDNLFAGTPYDQTFDPKKDNLLWDEWFMDKLKKNYPAKKDVHPLHEEDIGDATVGFFDGNLLYANCKHCKKKIISFLNSSKKNIYSKKQEKIAWQPDLDSLHDNKVDNQQQFGTNPVNLNEQLYQDKIMGSDKDRVVSNVELSKRNRRFKKIRGINFR